MGKTKITKIHRLFIQFFILIFGVIILLISILDLVFGLNIVANNDVLLFWILISATIINRVMSIVVILSKK